MPVEEIPRHEWVRFCETFSHQHHGWLIDLEIVDRASAAAARDVRRTEGAEAGPQESLASVSLEYDLVGRSPSPAAIGTATLPRHAVADAALESVEARLSASGGEDQIAVTADLRSGGRWTHVIHGPVRMRRELTEGGADQALHIDTSDGQTVTLRFPITAPMEMLDGYVAEI